MEVKNKRWTKEEEEFLARNFLTMSVKEIAGHLGRSRSSVYNKASRLETLGEPKEQIENNNTITSEQKKLLQEIEAIHAQRRQMDNNIYKCSVCGEEKKGSEFHFYKNRKISQCKSCRAGSSNKHRIERIKQGRDW